MEAPSNSSYGDPLWMCDMCTTPISICPIFNQYAELTKKIEELNIDNGLFIVTITCSKFNIDNKYRY